MLLTKLKMATATLLVVALIGCGTGLLSRTRAGEQPGPPPKVDKARPQDKPVAQGDVSKLKQQLEEERAKRESLEARLRRLEEQLAPKNEKKGAAHHAEELQRMHWALTGSDSKKRNVISVKALGIGNSLLAPLVFAPDRVVLQDVPLAKDAKVFIDGREAKLADLTRDMRLMIRLAEDRSSIRRIEARRVLREQVDVILKSVDLASHSITVGMGGLSTITALPVAKDARIRIEAWSERGLERDLRRLQPGMRVSLELGVEKGRIVVRGMRAFVPTSPQSDGGLGRPR
jgi:hypothetical protein